MKNLIILFLVISSSCCFESPGSSQEIVIMSWNVQNLFDGVDNGEEYSEFSVANGSWSEELYTLRLELISSIIKLNKPHIVALQEIEGSWVLEDLGEILDYPYRVSTNGKGAIEVGFLSTYPIISSGIIDVGDSSSGLRDILEIHVDIEGEKIRLFNNHWKSKSGGNSEALRIVSARALRSRLEKLRGEELIILGDLNENYNESELKYYETAISFDRDCKGLRITTSRNPRDDELYTPWKTSNLPGSYQYREKWETIDHFLLSPALMDSKGFSFSSFKVDNREELFNRDGSIKKWFNYTSSGYSDHLPIVLEIDLISDVVTDLE